MKKENELVTGAEGAQYFDEVDRSLNDIHTKSGRIRFGNLEPHVLGKMVDFMQRVIYGTQMPYEILIDQKSGNSVVKVQELGTYFPMLPAFVKVYAADLHYSPLLRLFWKAYRAHPNIHEAMTWWLNRTMLPNAERAAVFNNFVLSMRQLAKEQRTKTEIANWQRTIKANGVRLQKYLDALFDEYGRLDFIRLDFYFHACSLTEAEADVAFDYGQTLNQGFWENGESEGEVSPIIPEGRISLEEVEMARDRFLGNARRKTSLFKNMVGHVTRIEFSRAGQYHMHLALIFAHSEIKSHAWLAEQIGNYWEKMTDGRGYAHNCNRKKYKYPVLGAVNYYETEKREDLVKVLRYLAKLDQFVHVKEAKRCKLFTTGHFPKVKEKRFGRPRKKGVFAQKKMSEIAVKSMSETAMSQMQNDFSDDVLEKNTLEA